MRFSKMLIPTLRETPADAEAISHILMLRAGYHQTACRRTLHLSAPWSQGYKENTQNPPGGDERHRRTGDRPAGAAPGGEYGRRPAGGSTSEMKCSG